MDTKTRPLYILSTRDPPQNKRHIQTEREGLEKKFHENGDQEEAGVVILISDKIDFDIKAMKRDKEGHYTVIKGSIQEEDTTVINMICTQYRSTAVCKANANKYERGK